MSAPGQSTFDGNPNLATPTTTGYRAGIADFNGAACIDDPQMPPSPPTMGTAACWNTFGAQLVSCSKAIACGGLCINGGSSPTVQFAWTAANLITSSPFTVTRVSAGKVQITWPANTFPIVGWPKAYLNDSSGAVGAITAFNITNGVQVNTFLSGAAADANFSVDLF